MSFEQPVYRSEQPSAITSNIFRIIANMAILPSFSYPGGEPPTPTKTPTSPNFFLDSFQTPKQDSRFHGSFSPWSPAFAAAASPNFKTPTHLSFTTPTKSPTKPSIGKNTGAKEVSNAESHSPNISHPLPLVEPSIQRSPSPSISPAAEAKRRRHNGTEFSITPLKTTFEQEAGQSMNSAGSMQTPPPTSTSASRRKSQQTQVTRLAKESAEKERRMSFPALSKADSMDNPISQVEESPQHYSTLQFSPEGFGYPTSGPATAPVYPQHKLFWDPEQGGDTMNVDFPMDDTFTTNFGLQKNLDSFVSGHEGSGITFPTSPAFNILGTGCDNSTPFASSAEADVATHKTASIIMSRKQSRGNGVDPSLLFSSPGRASEASNMPGTSQKIQDDNLLPYAHQLRDAQMELEMQMSRKPKRKRGAETDSPAVKAALQTLRDDQAGVTRDLTDDIIPFSATQRPSSRTSSGLARETPVAGRSALHKHRSKGQLQVSGNELPRHKRTSVTLTIDATGRAKTETKLLADNSKPSRDHIEVDSEEESDSTSSSSNDEMVMSQTQSFAYPAKQKPRQPKLGRFTHNSHSHSQKSSYASTLGSTNVTRTGSDVNSRPPSSNLFVPSGARSQHSRVSFNDPSRDEGESEAETIIDSEDDKGDAQSALKKVLQSRQKQTGKRSLGSNSKHPPIEQRYAYPSHNAPSHPYYATESFTPSRNGYHQSYQNTSPTTITDPDLATPSSGRSNLSSDSVRCLCRTSDDDGQLMIQW